jgi:hypothetical protein
VRNKSRFSPIKETVFAIHSLSLATISSLIKFGLRLISNAIRSLLDFLVSTCTAFGRRDSLTYKCLRQWLLSVRLCVKNILIILQKARDLRLNSSSSFQIRPESHSQQTVELTLEAIGVLTVLYVDFFCGLSFILWALIELIFTSISYKISIKKIEEILMIYFLRSLPLVNDLNQF